MGEVHYMISEAAKRVNVETHVLRYWEEELQLPIKRNELGHRYYTEDDKELFLRVKQLKEKLKWIRGVTENTETVTQARELVNRKAKEWNVKKDEAARRIKAGRLFYQVLGSQGYKWDSTQVHDAITEFDKTPSYDELQDKLMEKFGADLQDTEEGRETLRDWIEENDYVPADVYGSWQTPPNGGDEQFLFDDEAFNEYGEIVDIDDDDALV